MQNYIISIVCRVKMYFIKNAVQCLYALKESIILHNISYILDHAVSTKFITHQGSTIENEALQNVTLISFDKVLPITIDCSGGIWDESRYSTKWTGGRYAKGRRKFNCLLEMIDKKRLNIKTSDIKHVYNCGCKKFDNDYYGVLQFR